MKRNTRTVKRVLMIGLVFAISLGIFRLQNVVAAYHWDASTQVILRETSYLGPALVYDPSAAKSFMAWFGTDGVGSLNVIQSSDMKTWSGKVTFAAPGTCCDTSNQQVKLDLAYDPDNQKIYLAYQIDLINGLCPTFTNNLQIWVQSSSDGTTWSSPAQVGSTETISGVSNTIGPFGISFTYDNIHHQFELVVYNPDGNSHLNTYTSTDGISWGGPQVVYYNNNQVSISPVGGAGSLRFLNGNYFLVYATDTRGPKTGILQSSDGSTWTSQVTTSLCCSPGAMSYDASEGLYHLVWPSINDATSPDGISWSSPISFQSERSYPGLTYNSNAQSLLLAWTGTNCCAGSLNVMQYVNPGATPTLSLSTDPSSVNIVCGYYTGCCTYYIDPSLCAAGSTITATLTITSLNGFSGTASLAYSPPRLGGPYLTGPSSGSVSSGGPTSVTITAHSGGATSGPYVWTISATLGGYTGSTTFTINYYYCRSCV